MQVDNTNLTGVLVITPKVHQDPRGFFFESFQAERYRQIGIEQAFVQDNVARSSQGVLRGLHYQLQYPQGKLVSVTSGEAFDVAVDIRVGSPTFAQWYGTVLSDTNHKQLYVPPGFAHGYCVITEIADFIYRCTEYYHPEDEYGVKWNDPELNIQWPIDAPLLSEKDLHNSDLKSVNRNNLPKYQPSK